MANTRLPLTQLVVLLTLLGFLLAGIPLFTQDAQTPSEEVVYEHQGPGMTHPKPVYQPPPEYADRPRRKKIQGNVFLSMIVTADGTVRDPQVTQSLDKDLDKKALECVSKWKFDPATKDGQPVAMRIAVEVNFHLY
ncbi:MAG: energy transducer TonB [Candidatus Sulfotelmatobacter sp.]